jgi:hypothetical protein
MLGGFGIYWAHSHTSTAQFQPLPGAALRIAVQYQMPWVVNDSGQIYRWKQRRWDPVPGPRAFDIGAGAGTGSNSGVWIIAEPKQGDNYSLYKWTGSNWSKASGAALRVDVDRYGNPWVVDAGGKVWRFANNRWENFMSMPAVDVSVLDGPKIITVPGELLTYNSASKKWERFNVAKASAVADRSGQFWYLNARKEIFRASRK